VIEQRGSFFTYGEQRIGQGRENARQNLKENPALVETLEALIRSESARRGSNHGEEMPVEEILAQAEAA
jgi:recombination protein RecA